MTESVFHLPITPRPCPRPQVSKFGIYYPGNYKKWKKDVATLLLTMRKTQYAVPLSVFIVCSLVPPASLSKKRFKLATEGHPDFVPHGDIDNFVKAILDGMTDAGIWTDDKLVVQLTAYKRYAEQEGVEIRVAEFYPVTPSA